MKKIFQMGLIISILNLLGCGPSAISKKEETKSNVPGVSFEKQLETFKNLGFTLNEGVSISDIDRWEGHASFEKDPYSLLYITLGQTVERYPWTPLTNQCWDFDTEAIEDHGSYVRIFENLERIARGKVKFENIKDYVDLEQGKAWVSFTMNGDNYKWDLKVTDDWVDADLFGKIVALTKKYNTPGKYTYFDTGGQDAVIGFETPEDLVKIKTATGLNIVWLN